MGTGFGRGRGANCKVQPHAVTHFSCADAAVCFHSEQRLVGGAGSGLESLEGQRCHGCGCRTGGLFVCLCVCACVRERERERERLLDRECVYVWAEGVAQKCDSGLLHN